MTKTLSIVKVLSKIKQKEIMILNETGYSLH